MAEIKGNVMLENQANQEPQDIENESIDQEQTEDISDEPNTVEDVEGEQEGDDEQEDEIVVSIGDVSPQEEERKPAAKWIKEVRKINRELARKNRELEAQLNSTRTEPNPVKVVAKPTLDGCDYDSERYEAELSSWYEQKRQADLLEAQAKEVEAQQIRKYQERLAAYGKAKAELRVRDYEEAEETVLQHLDIPQQNVIVKGAENAALVVYALGKNPAKAKELASIKDQIDFAFAVARLEKDLKVSNRAKKAPPPEKVVTGSGRISGSVDSELERLRAHAEKTGDISAVLRYKRQRKK
jgi:hypothetical protein